METPVIELIGILGILIGVGYVVKIYIDGLVAQALSQFATFQANMNANDKLITDTIANQLEKVANLLTPSSK